MIETQIVGEAVAGESAKVRKELESLIQNLHKSTFDVAELLHKVKKNKYYYPEFETFSDYYKSLDIKERKAQYLERIVDVMEQVGIDRNTYEPLGSSKLREITSLDPNGFWTNPENNEQVPLRDFITGMVDKAQEMTYDDVKQHVKTLKGFVGENDIINKTFGWTKATWEEVINPGIELVRRNAGSVGRDEEGNAVDITPSKCVEYAFTEYMNDPANNTLSEEETNAG